MRSLGQLAVAITAVATLLFTAGCQTVSYQLRPPPTNAGKACVTQCTAIREACRGNELHRVHINMEACERREDSVIHACIAGSHDADRRTMCELSRPPCSVVEEMGHCENDHRTCFVQCGGTVDEVVTNR